jgi:hypothetical protein
LTADSWSTVINNIYTRPTYRNPYYYLHNVNRDLLAKTEGGSTTYEDSSSHSYNGTSGNALPNSRTTVPTDPYGSDFESLSTEFSGQGNITDINGNNYANDKSVDGGVSRVIDIKGTGGNTNTFQVNAVERVG